VSDMRPARDARNRFIRSSFVNDVGINVVERMATGSVCCLVPG
jgi:hypothetical protein